MKFRQTENPGFQHRGKEVSLALPTPQETLGELMESVKPGQELTGVRVVGGKMGSYEPSSEMVLGAPGQVLRRFELRHTGALFTLVVEQNVREDRAAGLYSGIYTHVGVEDPWYVGSYVLLSDGTMVGKSGITDSETSEPKQSPFYDWDDLRPYDVVALETLRDDIYSSETEMRVADVRVTGPFGQGELLRGIVQRPQQIS